jgi:hypothetical protein
LTRFIEDAAVNADGMTDVCVVESIETVDENRRLFATSACEGLVERECPVAIVVEFVDGNTNTIRVERKNTAFEIRPFETAAIEIAVTGLSDLKMIEEML